MVYGYARVSTIGQAKDGNSLEYQDKVLRENGVAVVWSDAFTGTKMDRPEFQRLLSVVREGDTIVVTKLDRISRSASQGIELADKLIAMGVKLHILNMGILDNTPTGKLIRNIMFSFAEFERDMIVQRTSEGKAMARQRSNYREGRKPVEIDMGTYEKCLYEADRGVKTVSECCEMLGISRSTWYNLARKRKVS